MSIISPMDTHGPYTPFEKPVPVPTTAITDDPLMHVCFNSDWLPAITGALKVLCRPETWSGTLEEINAAQIEAFTLLASGEDGCDFVPPHPNWYLDLDINYTNYDADAWNNPILGLIPGVGPFWKYTLVAWGTGLGGSDFTVIGRDWDTGDLVGGHYDEIRVGNELDPSGQTYVLTTLDCLGNTVVNSDFTPRDYSGDFLNLHFVTGNITTYILKFLIVGDWTCAPV